MSKISEIIENKKQYDGVTLVDRMKEYHTPAVSIAIIENYKLSDTYACGVKKRRTKNYVTSDTLFQAASISKSVFAAAVMRLTEQGILDIDTDITEYLNDFNLPTYDNKKHKITLRQLLSHNAGLNLDGFAGYQQGQRIPTVDQILTGAFPANHLKLKLIKDPETGFMYSGGGYVLAQKVVTTVCKRNFNDLMHDLIFAPLSMTSSAFTQPLPKDKCSQAACGYSYYDLQLAGGSNVMPELSAAGLWTTPSDLALFGIEIMKSIKGISKFLEKKTAETMTAKAFENSDYGLGLCVNQSKKGLLFGHNGSNFGFHSNMMFCPDEGTGIVIMQNSDIGDGICDEITKSFMDVYEISLE